VLKSLTTARTPFSCTTHRVGFILEGRLSVPSCFWASSCSFRESNMRVSTLFFEPKYREFPMNCQCGTDPRLGKGNHSLARAFLSEMWRATTPLNLVIRAEYGKSTLPCHKAGIQKTTWIPGQARNDNLDDPEGVASSYDHDRYGYLAVQIQRKEKMGGRIRCRLMVSALISATMIL